MIVYGSSQKFSQKLKRRKRSDAWNNFTEVKNDGNGAKVTHATCNYCGQNLACGNRNGTSSLSSHKCASHPLYI